MTLKLKLIGALGGTSVLGLALFATVAYDSSVEFKNRYELRGIDAYAKHIASMLERPAHGAAPFEASLSRLASLPLGQYHALLFEESGRARVPPGAGDGIRDLASLEEQIGDDWRAGQHRGIVQSGDLYTIWSAKPIGDSGHGLVLFEQLPNNTRAEFVTVFGPPLLVAGIIVTWIATWGALILASLFRRLDAQKAALARQAEATQIARDEALRAAQAKSAFLANMSHEIRTPLAAVIGYSESLLDGDQSASERLNTTHTIVRNGRHLLQIINDILDVSKIEAEKLQIERVPVNPMEIVEDVRALAGLRAEEKGLGFYADYAFPLPAEVLTDPVRLKQILLNLCSNAIKFTEKGEVRITVRCEREAQKIRFAVSDTGIGIEEQHQAKLFQAFMQAETDTTRRYGGTGLGLHLSRSLAERLGGDISLESTPGAGSCFTLTVDTGPLDDTAFVDSCVPRQANLLEAPGEAAGRLSGKVLIVEDNEDNQRLISMYARKAGAETTVAANGEAALERALGGDFDLVLMDMQMPVMDGVEATRALRDRGYRGPIVALTANAMKEAVEQCRAAGCDHFLTKPIVREEFFAALERYLAPGAQSEPPETALVSTLLDEDPSFGDLVAGFVAAFPAQVEHIRDALRVHDWAELRFLLHDLKSVGGGYGFPAVTDVAAGMEAALERGEHTEVAKLLGSLESLQRRITLGGSGPKLEQGAKSV